MKKLGVLAMLSVLTLGQVSYGDVEVWARRRVTIGQPASPVQVTGAIVTPRTGGTTFDVHFSYTDVYTAVDGQLQGEWTVWVFDRDAAFGDPAKNIGAITIDVSAAQLNDSMGVLIAPAPIPNATRSVEDFAVVWDQAIAWPGAMDLESISVTPTGSEYKVSLGMSIGGDVGRANVTPRDELRVGQIYRMQVEGRNVGNTLIGGNIHANITALAPDRLSNIIHNESVSATIRRAIGIITAAKSIQGTISAPGDVDFLFLPGFASIESVRLTNATTNDVGITGNILAQRGTINSILTTGKIGTNATTKSQIRAGRGILQIRAVDGSQVLARDFYADVTANLLGGDVDAFSLRDKSLNKLETAGNFIGTINADFIRPPTGTFTELDWGIFVGGTFTGDIHVRASVLGASIAIGTFTAPTNEMPNTGHIDIYHALDGAVVATAIDGRIPFLSIGRTPRGNGAGGFIGSNCEPQSLPFRPWAPQVPFDPGATQPDSVISAPSIGFVTISHMLQVEKRYSPRIESPSIDEAVIDDFREGVVWSGSLEYEVDGNGQPLIDTNNRPVIDNLATNDYASIGALKIQCLMPGGAVWFQNTSLTTVAEHLLGEFHLPHLQAGEQIRIAQRLGRGRGTSPDSCGCANLQYRPDRPIENLCLVREPL